MTLFPVVYHKHGIPSLSPLESSSSIHRLFLPATHAHRVIPGWQWFSASQGTNISQDGQRGWDMFPSSRVNFVPCTWWCTTWIKRLLRIVVRPSQPPTGHLVDPAALGKYTLYKMRSRVPPYQITPSRHPKPPGARPSWERREGRHQCKRASSATGPPA